jgi:hypothetical protein
MSKWIQTYTGIKFNYDNITKNSINIEDIAHSLSMLCRFTGHTDHFYSVAQHSVNCALVGMKMGDISLAKAALFHDASEAYLNDINSIAKSYLPVYKEIELSIQDKVLEKFNVPNDPYIYDIVKEIDKRMLVTEKQHLLRNTLKWDLEEYITPYNYTFLDFRLADMTTVKSMFFHVYTIIEDSDTKAIRWLIKENCCQ